MTQTLLISAKLQSTKETKKEKDQHFCHLSKIFASSCCFPQIILKHTVSFFPYLHSKLFSEFWFTIYFLKGELAFLSHFFLFAEGCGNHADSVLTSLFCLNSSPIIKPFPIILIKYHSQTQISCLFWQKLHLSVIRCQNCGNSWKSFGKSSSYLDWYIPLNNADRKHRLSK